MPWNNTNSHTRLNLLQRHPCVVWIVRVGCCVLAATLALAAPMSAEEQLRNVLSGIESRYNGLATLTLQFEHTWSYASRPRRQEEGTLYLRRPMKMIWEYTKPAGKLLIGDGQVLHMYNPQANQVRRLNIIETGDLRTPLAFLLGRLRFQKLFRKLRVELLNNKNILVGEGRSGNEAYRRVEFTYDPLDFRLLHLRVIGRDESINSFRFENERINVPLTPDRFHFHPPSGAEIINDPRYKEVR